MKNEIKELFEVFAKHLKLKTSETSHFDGDKYVVAKEGTISLNKSDIRCGNRIGIIGNGKNGTISLLSGYLPPKELIAYMNGYIESKRIIKQMKNI